MLALKTSYVEIQSSRVQTLMSRNYKARGFKPTLAAALTSTAVSSISLFSTQPITVETFQPSIYKPVGLPFTPGGTPWRKASMPKLTNSTQT